MKGVKDSPCDREKVSDRDEGRNWPSRLSGSFGQKHGHQLGTESGEIETICDEDNEDGVSNKIREHVAHPPVPFACNHDDGRGGEVGERPAHRDVYEKEAKGGIAQIHTWLELVESLHEEQGADGHCGRLGNEGTQKRSNGEYRKPPCYRGLAASRGEQRKAGFREAEDRLGARNGHDH